MRQHISTRMGPARVRRACGEIVVPRVTRKTRFGLVSNMEPHLCNVFRLIKVQDEDGGVHQLY